MPQGAAPLLWSTAIRRSQAARPSPAPTTTTDLHQAVLGLLMIQVIALRRSGGACLACGRHPIRCQSIGRWPAPRWPGPPGGSRPRLAAAGDRRLLGEAEGVVVEADRLLEVVGLHDYPELQHPARVLCGHDVRRPSLVRAAVSSPRTSRTPATPIPTAPDRVSQVPAELLPSSPSAR
jgi:hypothetical protein